MSPENSLQKSKNVGLLTILRWTILLPFVLLCSWNIQQLDVTGVWYFDRFGGPHGEIAESSSIVKANQQNKGTIYNFEKDRTLVRSRPGGTAGDVSTIKYQILYPSKLVIIGGDTLKIMLLTSQILELYPKDETRPALFLKRSKDGKTAMSAP